MSGPDWALNRHPDTPRITTYDGQTLPFPDNTFDSALSLLAIQHITPRLQLVSLLELLRVVDPAASCCSRSPALPSHSPQPSDSPAAPLSDSDDGGEQVTRLV